MSLDLCELAVMVDALDARLLAALNCLADLIRSELTNMPPVKLSSLFTLFKMYSLVFLFLMN